MSGVQRLCDQAVFFQDPAVYRHSGPRSAWPGAGRLVLSLQPHDGGVRSGVDELVVQTKKMDDSAFCVRDRCRPVALVFGRALSDGCAGRYFGGLRVKLADVSGAESGGRETLGRDRRISFLFLIKCNF